MSQAEFKRRLKALMLKPENQVCSDCPERQPRWASLIVPPPGAPPGSLPMGAFCCLECSGSHRRLGVHISFVRSVNLDSWKEKEVLAMENGGNRKVNAIFEAHLSVAKPTNAASGQVRERFIRDKYERRKFYDPSAFDRVTQMEMAREQEEVVSGAQGRITGSRKPSDAARKRVEERAARNRSSSGASVTRSAARVIKNPAPVPPPTPAVDLLDFGDFDSPEATSAVQASASFSASATYVGNDLRSSELSSEKEPQLDLFANMFVGDDVDGSLTNGAGVQQMAQSQPAMQTPIAPEQKKMSNADIMSMFHSPMNPQQNHMQQNMFAMGGGKPNGSMTVGGINSNNMAMMNNMNGINPQQQMGMMNNMQMMQMIQKQNIWDGSMGSMGGNMTMGMMSGGQVVGNSMGTNTTMMPQQQKNNVMMIQGVGGGVQQGGNHFDQPVGGQAQLSHQGQQQRKGGVNQFAGFGNFGR